jgi:hypothetical protein
MDMIPENIIEFLERQIFMHVGTRDGKMRPREIMAWGIRMAEDKRSISILIPAVTAERTIKNLMDNQRIALTCVYIPNHESYQFKGTYLSHDAGTEKEDAELEKYFSGYPEIFKTIGMSPDFLAPVQYKPAVSVKFLVEEIFVQTPGPNAGKKIM